MKATISTNDFKELMDAMSSIVKEVKAECTNEGMAIKAVDPAHVSMIFATIPKSAFLYYDFDEISLGFDIAKIRDFISLVKTKDISFEYDDTKGRITFSSDNLTRKMANIDISSNDVKVPKLDTTVYAVVKASELKKGLKATSDVSETVRFTIGNEALTIDANNDMDEVQLYLNKSKLTGYEQQETPISSGYPYDYTASIIKSIPNDADVRLAFADQYPIKISFDINQSSVEYLIAPRVESE